MTTRLYEPWENKFQYNIAHPHCGPFNTIDRKEPSNVIDRACWKHDKEYGKIGTKAYTHWNKADEDFVRDLKKIGGTAAEIYLKPFELKKKIAPKLKQVSHGSF
jgi:hypothetical protein